MTWYRHLPLLLALLAVSVAAYLLRGMVPVDTTVESVRNFVAEAGWWGPPMFIAMFVFRSVLLIPGVILLVAGGICFGLVGGTLFGAAGLTSSGLVKFVIAHLAGRDRFLARMPKPMRQRLARIDGGLGAGTLGLVSAYPVAPVELIHIAAILAGMHAVPYLVAIACGSLVRAASLSLFGDALVDGRGFALAISVITILAVLPPAALWLRRRARANVA